MLKKITIIFLFLSSVAYAQLGGFPGSFARMGFGSRGISMGNAMTAVTTGDIVGYYNPALSPFQDDHLINLSYSFLSLDRTLNFVSYTKNFKIPNQPEGGAGVTFSWINEGVSNIDGRDADGFQIGTYSVSENQFLFAPAIRVSEKVSLGVGFKFYYSRLFSGVTSTSLGFDIGGLYKVNDKLNIGFAARDIASKYQWNTNDLYGENGTTTKDRFPALYDVGASYVLPMNLGLFALGYEGSNEKSNVIRAGTEITPVKDFAFRAGFDRFDFNADDKFGNAEFMLGIGYQKGFSKFIVGIDYSFVLEPYTHNPFQTISAVFKIK